MRKTNVMMLNLGGPVSAKDVSPYLTRFFSDDTVIQIPFKLGKYIGRMRGPYKIQKQYDAIGGYSPLDAWTQKQAKKMMKNLNKDQDMQYNVMAGYRYGLPLYNDQIDKIIKEDPDMEKLILFSQFPQYSCLTGGNILRFSLDHIEQNHPSFLSKVKVIDRWWHNQKYINSIARLAKEDIQNNFTKKEQENLLILFSSHSIPVRSMQQGDQYPLEIASTAEMVMNQIGRKFSYRVSWQSKVGFLEWLSPSTVKTMELYEKKVDNILIIPLGFTSDHLETLFELDIELIGDFKDKYNKIIRSRSLNDEDDFCEALSDIVIQNELDSSYQSKNLKIRCPQCKFSMCNKLAAV